MKSDNDPQKRLELIEALSAQMLQCVYELHVIGFVHGNVNPKNFRVDSKDGKVYIIDF
jgi:serine/threonine protein kinase